MPPSQSSESDKPHGCDNIHQKSLPKAAINCFLQQTNKIKLSPLIQFNSTQPASTINSHGYSSTIPLPHLRLPSLYLSTILSPTTTTQTQYHLILQFLKLPVAHKPEPNPSLSQLRLRRRIPVPTQFPRALHLLSLVPQRLRRNHRLVSQWQLFGQRFGRPCHHRLWPAPPQLLRTELVAAECLRKPKLHQAQPKQRRQSYLLKLAEFQLSDRYYLAEPDYKWVRNHFQER